MKTGKNVACNISVSSRMFQKSLCSQNVIYAYIWFFSHPLLDVLCTLPSVTCRYVDYTICIM